MIRVLSDYEVDRWREFAVAGAGYTEGVEYLGYWLKGDSVLVRDGSKVICLSREALGELFYAATSWKAKLDPRCDHFMSPGPPWYAAFCKLKLGHEEPHDFGTKEEAYRGFYGEHRAAEMQAFGHDPEHHDIGGEG